MMHTFAIRQQASANDHSSKHTKPPTCGVCAYESAFSSRKGRIDCWGWGDPNERIAVSQCKQTKATFSSIEAATSSFRTGIQQHNENVGIRKQCDGFPALYISAHVPGAAPSVAPEVGADDTRDQFLKTTLVSRTLPVTGLVSCSDNQRSMAALQGIRNSKG